MNIIEKMNRLTAIAIELDELGCPKELVEMVYDEKLKACRESIEAERKQILDDDIAVMRKVITEQSYEINDRLDVVFAYLDADSDIEFVVDMTNKLDKQIERLNDVIKEFDEDIDYSRATALFKLYERYMDCLEELVEDCEDCYDL